MPRSPLGPTCVADLTPKERAVYRALKPHLDRDQPFKTMALARKLGMTRSLFNGYLTRLWRATIIVRIERGRYVWPSDPRAQGAPVPSVPAKLLPREIRRAMAKPPSTIPGITLAMLMGGRARARRRPVED